MAELGELKYDFFYSPYFSYYYFFRNLKQLVRSKNSSSMKNALNEGAISVVDQYFAELPENPHRDGINLLQDHQNECFEMQIILNEKNHSIQKIIFFQFCFQYLSNNCSSDLSLIVGLGYLSNMQLLEKISVLVFPIIPAEKKKLIKHFHFV